MNGPDHFAEAQRLLDGAKGNPEPSTTLEAQIDHNTVVAASVHALLALTAAVAETTAARGPGDIDHAWLPILRGDV